MIQRYRKKLITGVIFSIISIFTIITGIILLVRNNLPSNKEKKLIENTVYLYDSDYSYWFYNDNYNKVSIYILNSEGYDYKNRLSIKNTDLGMTLASNVKDRDNMWDVYSFNTSYEGKYVLKFNNIENGVKFKILYYMN